MVIHCGDLINHGMVKHFKGFNLIYVYGNCDVDSVKIERSVKDVGKNNFVGPIYTGKLDGKKILAMHGNIEGSLMEAIQSKRYDYVFRGHTHLREDQMHFKTRVINPGALGGLKRERRSFCILDLTTNNLEFVNIPDLIDG